MTIQHTVTLTDATSVDPSTLPVGSQLVGFNFGDFAEGRPDVFTIAHPYTGRLTRRDILDLILDRQIARTDQVLEAIKAAGLEPDDVFFEIVRAADFAADDWEEHDEDECGNTTSIPSDASPHFTELWVAAFGRGNPAHEAKDVPANAVFTRLI